MMTGEATIVQLLSDVSSSAHEDSEEEAEEEPERYCLIHQKEFLVLDEENITGFTHYVYDKVRERSQTLAPRRVDFFYDMIQMSGTLSDTYELSQFDREVTYWMVHESHFAATILRHNGVDCDVVEDTFFGIFLVFEDRYVQGAVDSIISRCLDLSMVIEAPKNIELPKN